MSKYGNRGMRYILLDAGHICQNTLIAAEATGCGGCPVAAFYDDEVNALLGIDSKEETVLYAASVGKKIVPVKQCKL
jgi:SagB-type dehydrogenase family enzyme